MGAGTGFWMVGLQEDSKDKGRKSCKQFSIMSLATTYPPNSYLSSHPLFAIYPSHCVNTCGSFFADVAPIVSSISVVAFGDLLTVYGNGSSHIPQSGHCESEER